MSNASSGAPSPAQAVSVRRVPHAQPLTVCFAGKIAGLLTHQYQGKFRGCTGAPACPAAVHKALTLWKGYVAAREWEERLKRWYPIVLEVTECLEEQLRGRALAGEIWILTRESGRKRSGKVIGRYLERREEPSLTQCFGTLNALLRFYHSDTLDLGVPNPLAPRLLLPAVDAKGPAGLADAFPPDPPPATKEEIREMFRRAKEAGKLGSTIGANGR
jgi:hypothetical protein